MRQIERIVVLAVVVCLGLVVVADRAATPAVADRAGSAEAKVASVDVYDIMNKLINAAERVAKRDELVKLWNDRLTGLEKDMMTMRSTLQVLPQTDPEYKRVEAQLGAKMNEMQSARQEGLAQIERFQAEQLVEVYQKVAGTAASTAAELGYTHLIASRATFENIEPKSQETVLQELLARPLVVSPKTDDITANVKAKLGV